MQWLDESEMAAWRGFVDTLGPLLQALDADLASFGLAHGDYEVLVRLSEKPDSRMRMCDLAAELCLSPGGLTRRLDGLVRDGLVARERCAEDRRATYAVLTGAGLTKLAEAAPAHVEGVRRRFTDVLSVTEQRTLARALSKVREATACRPTPQ